MFRLKNYHITEGFMYLYILLLLYFNSAVKSRDLQFDLTQRLRTTESCELVLSLYPADKDTGARRYKTSDQVTTSDIVGEFGRSVRAVGRRRGCLYGHERSRY